MNRRGFLQRIGAAAIGLALARQLPGIGGEVPALVPPAATELAFKAGDILTFEGRYAVNPLTGKSLPFLQQFVVTADVVGSTVTVPVAPMHEGRPEMPASDAITEWAGSWIPPVAS